MLLKRKRKDSSIKFKNENKIPMKKSSGIKFRDDSYYNYINKLNHNQELIDDLEDEDIENYQDQDPNEEDSLDLLDDNYEE